MLVLVAVVDPPPSMASAQPSPSESKSKLLGVPSASVSVVHEIENAEVCPMKRISPSVTLNAGLIVAGVAISQPFDTP